MEMVWGIVPLYFGWLLNEFTSNKASARTALQTGFSFIWASAQWLYPVFSKNGKMALADSNLLLAVNMIVTLLILVLGIIAFISGLRGKFPRYCRFLGHSRFSNYFAIAIYPIQAHALDWSWDRLFAIIIFAFPIWIILHFALMPVRK